MNNYKIILAIILFWGCHQINAQHHVNTHRLTQMLIEGSPEFSTTFEYNQYGFCVSANSEKEKISIEYNSNGRPGCIHRIIVDSVEINQNYTYGHHYFWQLSLMEYPNGVKDSTKVKFVSGDDMFVDEAFFYKKEGEEWKMIDHRVYHWEEGNLKHLSSQLLGDIHFDYSQGNNPFRYLNFTAYHDDFLHYFSNNTWSRFKREKTDGKMLKRKYTYTYDKDKYPISRIEKDNYKKGETQVIFVYNR